MNVDSRSPDDWNGLGVRRALQGEWRTARDCFERALAERGDVVEFWLNLGIASVLLHDEDTGRGAFEVAQTLAHRVLVSVDPARAGLTLARIQGQPCSTNRVGLDSLHV